MQGSQEEDTVTANHVQGLDSERGNGGVNHSVNEFYSANQSASAEVWMEEETAEVEAALENASEVISRYLLQLGSTSLLEEEEGQVDAQERDSEEDQEEEALAGE